ncbi:helix-turn-helix domain-containing protein [Streptobacillus moniliformis]|uniref:helix-turn-helix domain-containing protein n=1 Tax=Streptobacillus moniliformis TaxID=34105 RepID=UPI0007E35868|nr:helix-turn-helix transcriptional regulator [Streptobacillus moniliformis]
MITLGYKLKRLRKSKGLTLEKLAEEFSRKYGSGSTKSLLSIWENDKQVPTFTSLDMYSDYFNVSLDYLTGNQSETQKTSYDEIEIEKKALNENQKQRLNAFIQSNSIMFFNSNGKEDLETQELIEKALTDSFIKILKQKGEL